MKTAEKLRLFGIRDKCHKSIKPTKIAREIRVKLAGKRRRAVFKRLPKTVEVIIEMAAEFLQGIEVEGDANEIGDSE